MESNKVVWVVFFYRRADRFPDFILHVALNIAADNPENIWMFCKSLCKKLRVTARRLSREESLLHNISPHRHQCHIESALCSLIDNEFDMIPIIILTSNICIAAGSCFDF